MTIMNLDACLKARLLVTAATAIFTIAPGTVFAQQTPAPEDTAETTDQDDSDQFEERDNIIVTATRREQSIQDIPISVTAFQQKELTTKGIVGYEGLATETPGVTLNKPTANFNNFTARGIATNGYGANLQSTVTIYTDELPISANGNSTILDPNLFDVERVEFLRGPQGTLFGSGSLAGAVRILNKDPDLNDFDASALVDFGLTKSDSVRQRYNGMVNIPVIEDKAALRVVGFYRNEDGYVDNAGTGVENSNNLKDYGGRAIFLAEPTDRLSVRLLGSYEKSTPGDSSLVNPDRGEFIRFTDQQDIFEGELLVGNATVEYDFDFATLTSSSTYSDYDQLFYVDLGGTFSQAIAFGLDAKAFDEIFVEEVRLASTTEGPLSWIVGGFYNWKRRDVDSQYRSTPEFLAARGITGLDDQYYQIVNNHAIAEEAAVFGEVTYNFSNKFWATGGLRYSDAKVQGFAEGTGYSSNYLTNALFGIPGPLTITPNVAAEGVPASEDGLQYKASLSYAPMPELTTYATYATGFRTPVRNARAGSVSALDPNDIVIPDGAESDDLKSFEIGAKGYSADGKFNYNVAAYYIDWSNIQVQANRVSDTVQFATNIGKAVSKGIEMELGWRPAEGLFIGANAALNEAKVTELTPAEAAISGAEEDIRLSSPKFQGAIYARYDFEVQPGRDAFVTANLSHVGSYPGLFPNVPGQPTVQQSTYDFTEAFELVNLTAGTTFGDVTATLYVENVFDEYALHYVHPEAFLDGRYGTLRPRTFGIRLSYGIE